MQYINRLLVILKEGPQHNPTYHLTAQALPGLNPLDHASRLALLPHQDVQHLACDEGDIRLIMIAMLMVMIIVHQP